MPTVDLPGALEELGFPRSIHELRESGLRYVEAIPLLVSALDPLDAPRTQESIVRALSVPWAKKLAVEPLIHMFRQVPFDSPDPTEGLRWAIGNGLEILWDDGYYNELVELVQDKRYGRARQMIVLGFGRSRVPRAGDVLVGLLDDPDVNGHAVSALSKLRYAPARDALKPMVHDDRAWVRRTAKRALEKM